MFDEALKAISSAKRVIIHRHVNPDGDALGSQIGLRQIIRDNFPSVGVYAVGDVSKRYSFMDGSAMDIIPDSFYGNAVAVILDTSTSQLVSDERYKKAALTIRLDHHIFCEKIADMEYVDSTFESCAGLVTCFAKENGLAVSDKAAKALYTGMITDSGRFRYDSVSSKTFELASFLMEREFDTNDIYSKLYADELKNIITRASFITRIQLACENVAYIYTTREELASLGLDTFAASRGMVGTMSDIKGVDIWANFTETPNGVICEMRSNKFNVNKVAVKYGGGGHARASGATVADRTEAMALLDDLKSLGEEK